MISSSEREKLKNTIGPRHINQICTYLVRNNYFNRFGDPYTSDFVSRVFNGRVENKEMEQYILDFAEVKVKEEKKQKKKRADFFNSIPNDNGER